MTNAELNKWAATKVMRWHYYHIMKETDAEDYGEFWVNEDWTDKIPVYAWGPATDKNQCFDVVEKAGCELSIDYYDQVYDVVAWCNSAMGECANGEFLPRAILLALKAAMGGGDEQV